MPSKKKSPPPHRGVVATLPYIDSIIGTAIRASLTRPCRNAPKRCFDVQWKEKRRGVPDMRVVELCTDCALHWYLLMAEGAVHDAISALASRDGRAPRFRSVPASEIAKKGSLRASDHVCRGCGGPEDGHYPECLPASKGGTR